MTTHEYEFITAKGVPMRATVEVLEDSPRNNKVIFHPDYDRSPSMSAFGYYLEDLFANCIRLEASGLRLHTEIPEWHIDANSMTRLFDWMESL